MKKILFVEQNQDGTVGGSHYCLLYMVRSLNKQNYEPVVMFYEHSTLADKFITEGYPVVFFQKPKGITLKSSNIVFKYLLILLRKIFNFINVSCIPFFRGIVFIINNKIDVIHLNNSVSAGCSWLFAAKLLRKKCVTHMRGYHEISPFTKLYARYFDNIICVSSFVRQAVLDAGLTNSITLYDGMDPDAFKSRIDREADEIREEFAAHSCLLLGMVGNFQEWKGQHVVVQALLILHAKYPDFKCLFIGATSQNSLDDRAYFSKVRDAINRSGFGDNIFITGYREDIPSLINACDVMLHASVEPEPFGMVVLEAMCLGKPVIASDLGGPKEIIEDSVSGVLSPPGDVAALASAIEGLLLNPERRDVIGGQAMARVQNMFSLKKFSHEINSFYDELTCGNLQ